MSEWMSKSMKADGFNLVPPELRKIKNKIKDVELAKIIHKQFNSNQKDEEMENTHKQLVEETKELPIDNSKQEMLKGADMIPPEEIISHNKIIPGINESQIEEEKAEENEFERATERV